MGTNYYLHTKPPCGCCGRPYPPLHIGKSSAGWCFALHIIPEEGINDLDDWRRLWSHPAAHIQDEYGWTIPIEKMERKITERKWPRTFAFPPTAEQTALRKEAGVSYTYGPNGLLRHVIDGHCVKHGAGTWDCIEGEFS